MPPQNQMGGMNQQFAMGNNSNNMGMSGMSMQSQMGNNMNNLKNAQQQYQQRLIQQQAQLRNSGLMAQRAMAGQQNQMMNNAGQQRQGAQMANGQAAAQMNAMTIQQQQQQQQKKQGFYQALRQHTNQQGKHFDENPNIGGRPVDYLMLWQITTQLGGSGQVDRNNQWPLIANKLGFNQAQFPTAAEELKQLHANAISQYERLWFAAKQQHSKQEQARMHAHQMAGLGGAEQGSPTKVMPGNNQQNQFAQYQQAQQQQMQATPVQANAQLPQNGMATPQQQMLQHRRNSSLRKPEQMTPQQAAQPPMTAPSPHAAMKAAQRSPTVKQETGAVPMVNASPQSTNYSPMIQTTATESSYGGLDFPHSMQLGEAIARSRPDMPHIAEMGTVDTKAITLSLASQIHSEVRYALDTLCILSNEQGVGFDLEKCEDLMDVIVDCAEDQVEALSDEAAEVSDALDLAPYEDVLRACRIEADTLQEVHTIGTVAYDLDRAADKVIAITTILRNFSFYEHNHRLLTQSSLLKWLSNTIRLLGTRNMLLRTFYNTQDFYKDMIIFLSNVTQSLELPGRDDALHVLHFLLAFAPQPLPSYASTEGKISFSSFSPSAHRYLPPAVDCLAKLLARQDPNRMLYKSIFNASSSSLAISESPLDLLTRAFALSISVLPTRAGKKIGNDTLLRIVEARKAYLTQGMLAADILTSLLPTNEAALARAWVESDDGWLKGLLNLASVLSIDEPRQGVRDGLDRDTFKLIAHRALAMVKRLVEKVGTGSKSISSAPSGKALANGHAGADANAEHDDEVGEARRWEGVPFSSMIIGALVQQGTDKTALKLFCGLFEMSMQAS